MESWMRKLAKVLVQLAVRNLVVMWNAGHRKNHIVRLGLQLKCQLVAVAQNLIAVKRNVNPVRSRSSEPAA